MRQSSSSRPSRTTPTTGGSPCAERLGERFLDRAGEARQLRQRQRAAADAADRLFDLAADRFGQPLGAGANHLERLVQHPQHRHLAQRALRLEVERERPLERRERELVRPQRALERVPPQSLDELGATDHDARLRAAEQLVAGEADEVGARGQALARGGLALEVDEDAGAEVVHERQSVPPGDRCQLGHRRLLGEADDAEVRLVHAQQHGGLGPDRALVVGGAGAIGRPDLAQPGARAREHVRDPEAVADLDQLAARDEHLPILGQRREREHHRRGVVVHDQRRLGAGQPPQDAGDVILPRAAAAGLQVVLEVRVAAPDLQRPFERGLRQRRPSEVRVHDHSCGIQRAPQRGRPGRRQLAQGPLDEIAGIMAGCDFFTRAREGRPRRLDRQRRRLAGEPLVSRELVHGGQIAQVHRVPV